MCKPLNVFVRSFHQQHVNKNKAEIDLVMKALISNGLYDNAVRQGLNITTKVIARDSSRKILNKTHAITENIGIFSLDTVKISMINML